MDYQKWKMQSARRKAIWPGDMKSYLHRQHKVTVSIDSDLAEWLITNHVGRSSFTGDLEETVITALRIVRGELPSSVIPPVSLQKRDTDASSTSKNPGS